MKNRQLNTEQWLNDYLLRQSSSHDGRALISTKLMDLIYHSYQLTGKIPENDGFPFSMENLKSDLFTALCSPIIRRRDPSALPVQERLFNLPVLESVISDDRFSSLKAMCEDKELPAFETAAAFVETLDIAVRQHPFSPTMPYGDLLHMLSEQVEATVKELQSASGDPAKEAHLRNRAGRKLVQIHDLTKKYAHEAAEYLYSIGEDIGNAIESSLAQATYVTEVFRAWGSQSGAVTNTPVDRRILEHAQNSRLLQDIAHLLGKYRELVADKRRNAYAYGRGEKYDITTGNDITNCLSAELALLGTPETEILFMRKYQQKQLLQYRKRMEVVKGKGDMIVLLDESGSTEEVQPWAKAFALAMLDIAAKDKRKFALVHFSSKDQLQTDLFEPGQYTSEDVMRSAEHFFDGGTDFEAPLREALSLMEMGYEDADITVITDGECDISPDFATTFRSTISKHKATVTGILLDKGSSCGESLLPFCDKVYHSKDITEDEIAVEILNRKAS